MDQSKSPSSFLPAYFCQWSGFQYMSMAMGDHHRDPVGTVILPSTGPHPGVEIVDPIERLRRTIRTEEPVTPSEADPSAFPMPVESAVEVETSGLSLPIESQIYLRDASGQMIDEVQLGEHHSYPTGSYCIEPPWIIKLYIGVESSVDIIQDEGATELAFGETTTVRIGSCSTHERPATTVTVTPEPEAILEGVSAFGSAIKTTSPERAFPSHRGHPPRLEIGDETDVPEGIDPPADDVHIEVPAAIADAFVVAPLAYYLGAEVQQGIAPRIVAPGFEHSLLYDGSLEDGVRRTLEQLYLLDCITRTEGIYQLDLYERQKFDERFDMDLAELYEASHPARVERYLEIDYARIEDLIPDWKHAAHVEPSAEHASMLPYLVDDLSLIKAGEAKAVPAEEVEKGSTRGLVRGEAASDANFVTPEEPSNAIDEAWVGDGAPIGASKAVPAAFENRIGRSMSTGSIEIVAVCNDDRMGQEEDIIAEVYGNRTELPFDVSVRRNTTIDELATILAEDRDFLHYIGHIDEEGFRCSDGKLDTGSIDNVGMDSFFLNACQSYEQGIDLIEAGAIGGIVTLRDVANYGAHQIGRAVARLLNCGFSLRAALNLAREESIIGCHYIVVGDGGLSIVQPESGTPHLLEISKSGSEFHVDIDLYGAQAGMGGLFCPHMDDTDDSIRYYLATGSVPEFTVSGENFDEFLHREDGPVLRNGFLYWSEDLSVSDF